MFIYYCPNCGNVTAYGIIEIFGSSFEEQEKVTATVKRMINDVKIPLAEQKLCFICKEAEKRRNLKQLGSKEPTHINYCLKCFDLMIDKVWQKFNFQQRESMRLAFLNNALYLDGDAIMKCPSCVEINDFIQERNKNVYNDSFKPFYERSNK